MGSGSVDFPMVLSLGFQSRNHLRCSGCPSESTVPSQVLRTPHRPDWASWLKYFVISEWNSARLCLCQAFKFKGYWKRRVWLQPGSSAGLSSSSPAAAVAPFHTENLAQDQPNQTPQWTPCSTQWQLRGHRGSGGGTSQGKSPGQPAMGLNPTRKQRLSTTDSYRLGGMMEVLIPTLEELQDSHSGNTFW